MENENTEVQGGSAAGAEEEGQGWPFGIDPSQVDGQEPVSEEEPEEPKTEEAQPAEEEVPAEALAIYRALQNPETKDDALRLIHAIVGHEPEPQKPQDLDLGQKPENWAQGDWEYLQMSMPYFKQAVKNVLAELGLDTDTVVTVKQTAEQTRQARIAAEQEQKAAKMYGVVKTELMKSDKTFPQFTQEQYMEAVKAYPGYKYRDAVKLYMNDRAKAAPRGAMARPEIANPGDRRTDAPPSSLAETLSRGIRSKMLG